MSISSHFETLAADSTSAAGGDLVNAAAVWRTGEVGFSREADRSHR
jgi:hypothetical protein